MADDTVLIIITFVMIALTIIAFSKEGWDYLSIALLGCVICVGLVVGQETHAGFDFVDTIDIETILFIFGMQLVVIIGESEHVFEWVAIKMIRATKGNQRQFFYLTIILGIGLTAFVGDLSVTIIFIPLIIKTCRILEVPAGTYSLGLAMSIKMGTLITPYSCPENFLTSIRLNLSVDFFLVNLGPLAIILSVITLLLLDRFLLRKETQVQPERKILLLDLLDPGTVVENKQRFRAAGIGIILLFVCLFAFHDVPAFLFVILFGFSLVLITQRKISNLFKDIEWNLIFFFITLFILVGVLSELGFMQLIGNGIVGIAGGNIVVASVAIFVFSSLAAAPLINAPVILFFLPLIQVLEGGGFALAPLAVALILGTNIGSTFLPQGAPSEMVALSISRKFNVPNFSFSRLMRTGVAFTAIHFSICLLYVVLFSVFYV